ncbi:hypothetical protein DZB84_18395 [Bacillus sp. HNG]|nr:hypothetical protein DZB84_18395 [Bacillus sp. HNG]
MKRININMSKELYEWYYDNSKKAGTTVSALMKTVLNQYKEGRYTVTNEVINDGIQKIENIIVKSQPRGKQKSGFKNPSRQEVYQRFQTEQITQYITLTKSKDILTDQIINAYEKGELLN